MRRPRLTPSVALAPWVAFAAAAAGCAHGSRAASVPTAEAAGRAQLRSGDAPRPRGEDDLEAGVTTATFQERGELHEEGVDLERSPHDPALAGDGAPVLPVERDAFAIRASERLARLDARARGLTRAVPGLAELSRARRAAAYRRYAAGRNGVDAAMARLEREPDATWGRSRAVVERSLDALEGIVDAVHEEP